ncbi:MAG: ABC transporter substrate-binding protein [Pseudomonadota bacterium]
MVARMLLLAALLPAAAWSCERAGDSSRIAVAGGSITEIVYLLDAQDRLAAVDTTSNYPPEATELPSIGYVRALSAEGMLSLNPTLILGEDDMGPPEVLDQIRSTNVEIMRLEEVHTGQGIIDKVRCVGQILGLQERADQLIAGELEPALEELRALERGKVKAAVLLNLRDGTPTAAGAETSGNGLLAMAGATNVFGSVDGWKPMSLEAMVKANPDVIVMPERGVQAAGGVDGIVANPAVRLTTAGRNRRIVALDGMTMLGFGPRTLGAAAQLAEAFKDASPNAQ